MADNRNGRNQAEPSVDAEALADLEAELDSLSFPATGAEVVEAVGDREVRAPDGTYAVEELVPETDRETFDSPGAVRLRVQRPSIAAAMKRVVEANETLPNAEFRWSQRKSYEKTFEELKAIDADDEDEGIQVITDWILEQVEAKGKLPGSRGVRRRAAKFCRSNGYEVRNDEWLGI